MVDIRLTAISNSLAKSYGHLRERTEGALQSIMPAGDDTLICGQCDHQLLKNVSTLRLVNAVAECPKCGTTNHLSRPSPYTAPIVMKRQLDGGPAPEITFLRLKKYEGKPWKDEIGIASTNIVDAFAKCWPPPRILYHYTSANGLMGIVSTGEFWATDIGFMNDSSELTYANAQINKCVEKFTANASDLGRSLLKRCHHPSAPALAHQNIYAICFSSNGDLLSQWRAYADSAKGFSLGFDAYEIAKRHQYRQVIYDPVVQCDMIENAIAQFLATVEMAKRYTDDPNQYLADFAEALSFWLTELSFSIKHPAFSEENEWRLIVETVRDYDLMSMNFRNAPGMIVPFIKLGISEGGGMHPLPLLEVIQGPAQHRELNLKAVHLMLEKHRCEHVEVSPSGTPLR